MDHPFQNAMIQKLEANKLPLNLPAEYLHPYYQGASILNIPSSIAVNLGAEKVGTARLLPEIEKHLFPRNYKHIAFLLVDGLGYDWLMQYLEREQDRKPEERFWSQIMADAALSPLTSISPSTTAAALSTLWTGVPPAVHGVLGYEVWLKELGILSNMILHSPAAARGAYGSLYNSGMDAESFVPVQGLASQLAQFGVKTRSMQHVSIVNSGLSSMLDQGAVRMPYRTISDMWVNFQQALQADPETPSYNWLYWSEHDSLGHPYGIDDPRVEAEFAMLGYSLLQFIRRMRKQGDNDLLLLISADHGHLVTPKLPGYDLERYPDVLETLAMLPSGDNRLPYFYVKNGRGDEMQKRFYQHWTEAEFAMMPSAQALESGLFGAPPFYKHSADRIGDYLVLPRGRSYLWWSARPNPLLGRHGGLSRTEMLVPLLGLEL